MQTNSVSPAEQIKKDIESARRDLNTQVEKVKLASVRDDFSDLDSNIANLPIRIQKLRDRKYAFDKILETQASEFQKQWILKRNSIQNQITLESNSLQNGLRPLESRVAALSVGSSPSLVVKSIQNELDSFETKVTATERSLKEMYGGISSEISKVQNQIRQIEFSLDQTETASFGFLPGESTVMAVKAVWTKDQKEDKEDPDGILFLTDQRLIFEQREEIATKKVLFVTTEREKVQQLQFEVPVASVESVKATKQGVFKNEDWLELELAHGCFAREARLHLDGQDCNTWQKLITQVKSREIDSQRALELDTAAVEKAQSAPTICPQCGGTITKPVLRGMDSITCDFCGAKIKI